MINGNSKEFLVSNAVQKTIKKTPLLKNGIDAAYSGLSRVGLMAETTQKPTPTGAVFIELDEESTDKDRETIETNKDYNEKIKSVLEAWEKDPSLVLEIDFIKKEIKYLSDLFSPKTEASQNPTISLESAVAETPPEE